MDEIFNYYVENTDLTFDLQPRSPEQGQLWFESHVDRHPILVYDNNGVLGWSSLSRWSTKSGYDQTVEVSIFVHHDARGGGIGKRLLHEIIAKAEQLGHHCILSRITAANDVSIGLHEQAGFELIGCMREVGFKREHWIDVLMYQLLIG